MGVLTKLDLMDAGTDASSILNGTQVPLKLGFIAVVNRSQADINGNKSISHALLDEQRYFESHPVYATMQNRCGTRVLAQTLSRLLIQHIRKELPTLVDRVAELTVQTRAKLDSMGGSEPVLDVVRALSLNCGLCLVFASKKNRTAWYCMS